MTDFPLTVIELEKVKSTNEYAGNLLKVKEITEGTVIWAMEQTEGKGQGDNIWVSEPGKNLTFSLILHPAFLPPEKQFFLNEAISLGVLDFVAPLIGLEKPSLKWPNDICAGNRKLGGILINNIISGAVFETSVAGIGLNINQTDFPSNVPNPVSIKMVTNMDSELKPTLIGICNSILTRYRQLQKGDIEGLGKDYCQKLIGYDRWQNYLIKGHTMAGKIKGVTESGKLMVQNRESQILEFDYHQIEFIF